LPFSPISFSPLLMLMPFLSIFSRFSLISRCLHAYDAMPFFIDFPRHIFDISLSYFASITSMAIIAFIFIFFHAAFAFAITLSLRRHFHYLSFSFSSIFFDIFIFTISIFFDFLRHYAADY